MLVLLERNIWLRRLFVGSLPYDVTQEKLQEIFSAVGNVESAEVVTDKFTGRSNGFGFVEMATEEDTQKAIQELNGKEVSGRNIVVNEARPREERPRSPGGFRDRGSRRY